jgi:hypothetical protein
MNFALVYLMLRSVRGRLIRALRLLRQPKYLIGVLGFAAWMTFWLGSAFVGPMLDGENVNVQFAGAELLFATLGDAMSALHLGVALLLALILSLWWLIPWSRMALDLTEAEIHMLTPMPLKRRHLIQYATLKSQPGILFGCTIMTIFLGFGGPLARFVWFLAFWVVLTLWDLHSKGRAMWLERQKELPPERAWRNRLLLVGAIVMYWIALGTAITALVTELVTLRPAAGQETFDFVRQTMVTYGERANDGLIGWLLLPFRWATAPLLFAAPGVDTTLRLTGAVVPLVLLLGHNEWVVRSKAKFEEAALAHAQREASKQKPAARYWKTSMRSRRRTPFPLPPEGLPELGILWKNSMLVTRFSYVNLALFGLAVIGLASLVPLLFHSFRGTPFIILSIGFMTMALSPLTGSQSYRNDLRADLTRVEMVRPWPIEGWKLFAAEAAGPVVYAVMTALFGAGLVLAMDLYLTLERATLASLGREELAIAPARIAAALGGPAPLRMLLVLLGVLPLLLALTCLSATLQNLLVLLFPGWVQLGAGKQQGAAAFGQNMIMFFGLGLAGLLCMVPAALIVALIVAVQTLLFGVPLTAWELPVLGIIAATPVAAVVALIVRAGGRVWDNLDPSREILEGSA